MKHKTAVVDLLDGSDKTNAERVRVAIRGKIFEKRLARSENNAKEIRKKKSYRETTKKEHYPLSRAAAPAGTRC